MNRPWKKIFSLNRHLCSTGNASSKIVSKPLNCRKRFVYNSENSFRYYNSCINPQASKYHIDFGADATLLNDIDTQRSYNQLEAVFGITTLRDVLHGNKSDQIIQQLNLCTSVEELFSLLDNMDRLTAAHISQSVLLLSDFQRIYYESYLQNLRSDQIDYSDEFMLGLYSQQLRNHQKFGNLLSLVNKEINNMTVKELACCGHYLASLGAEDASQEILDVLILQLGEVGKERIDLAHTIAALQPLKSLRSINMAIQCLPYVLEFIETMKTPQDLNEITYILQQINPILPKEILITYKHRYREVIPKQFILKEHYPVLLHVANFLNTTQWIEYSLSDLRDICDIVSPFIPDMTPDEILIINRILQSHLEPANILEPLTNKCSNYISKLLSEEQMSSYLILPHLLFCQVTYSPSDKKVALEKLTSDIMHRIFPSTLPAFYKILRYLKPQNVEVCDRFWNKITEVLSTSPVKDYVALRLSNKYMYFNIILSKYRNKEFENIMTDILLKFNSEGYVNMFPGKFSRLAAFIIAFGSPNSKEFIDQFQGITDHLYDVKDQLDGLECLILSRGLQISTIISKKKLTMPLIGPLLLKIDNLVGERVNSLAQKATLTLFELNILVKCHLNKKTICDGEFLHDVIKKYSLRSINKFENMSSQSMRDSAYNLSTCKVIIPSLFDSMGLYCVKQGERLLGETLQKILWMFYILGYGFEDKTFFECSSTIIYRDREIINSLSLLQCCTALAYYQTLSKQLVEYIFSINFMERLDKEVNTCYLKKQYPERIRKQLMHLNRAVCLEMPEHRVPWFHANYVKQITANEWPKTSAFERDVKECLYTVTNSLRPRVDVSERHCAPYGCKIHFCVGEKSGVEKTAIVLLDSNCFSKKLNSNGLFEQHIAGQVKHQTRQLELLGYKVVHIAASMWNSMHMAEPAFKLNYLSKKIFNKPYL